MDDTNAKPPPPGKADSLFQALKMGATSVGERLEAIKGLLDTVLTTNDTLRKTIETDKQTSTDFIAFLTESLKNATSEAERDSILKAGERTVESALKASENARTQSLEFGKSALVIFAVLAAGTAAISVTMNRD